MITTCIYRIPITVQPFIFQTFSISLNKIHSLKHGSIPGMVFVEHFQLFWIELVCVHL